MIANKACKFTKHLFVFVVATVIFSSCLQASEKKALTLEDIQKDPELLRTFARAIIHRPQIIQELQEKMCKHNIDMFSPWKEGKSWGELGVPLQQKLTQFVPKSQVQSILRRETFYLMDESIIANPMNIIEVVVEKGTPTLIKIGLNQDRNSLNLSFDISPKKAGEVFTRQEKSITNAPATKLLIAFDVTDIISKITTLGINAWDQKKDGYLTTFCPAD